MKKILIMIAFIFCMIDICSYSNKKITELSEKITNELEKGKGHLIKINQLTDFDWEKLYLFHPYTTEELVEETLGFNADILTHDESVDYFLRDAKDGKSTIRYHEGYCLFVFILNNQVLHFFDHRDYGGFAYLYRKEGYIKDEAVFIVNEALDGDAYPKVNWYFSDDGSDASVLN